MWRARGENLGEGDENMMNREELQLLGTDVVYHGIARLAKKSRPKKTVYGVNERSKRFLLVNIFIHDTFVDHAWVTEKALDHVRPGSKILFTCTVKPYRKMNGQYSFSVSITKIISILDRELKISKLGRIGLHKLSRSEGDRARNRTPKVELDDGDIIMIVSSKGIMIVPIRTRHDLYYRGERWLMMKTGRYSGKFFHPSSVQIESTVLEKYGIPGLKAVLKWNTFAATVLPRKK